MISAMNLVSFGIGVFVGVVITLVIACVMLDDPFDGGDDL